jgi:ABC-2 type transport system ATP-binding protein
MEIIKINKLTKNYGKNRGISNIDLEINDGEIYGFIGPNGAGKSTTIKTLLNFIFPTSGSAEILNKDIVKESKEIKELTSYVPSEVRYYSEVKVKDLLNYAESFFTNYDREYVKELCDDLEVELDKKIEELSLGNKKKVAIVQALLSNPKVIILDEPTNGLDPLIQQKLFKILLKEKSKGKTIFLSSHNLAEIEKFCDRVAIIKEGEIVDILDIKNMNRDLGQRVILKSNNIDIKKIEEISESIKIIDEEIQFIYKGNVNELISLLSKYNLEKLLIEEVNLEETFLNYYEGETK